MRLTRRAGQMSLTRRAVVAAGLLAATLPASARAADAQAQAPIQAPIGGLNQALIAAMKAGKATPFAQRFTMIAPAVDRAFDLGAILSVAVGPKWASFSPADQAQLLDAFRKFTIASYAANFDSYNGERIEIVPSTQSLGDDQVVATNLIAGDSTRIDYRMHNGPGGWKAIDVLLNGSISQRAVYRSDWRASVATGASGLIANLQRRTADLSGGAIR